MHSNRYDFKTPPPLGLVGALAIGTLLVGCSDTPTNGGQVGADVVTGDSSGSDGQPQASNTPAEVSACKDACNQLKFFNCNDAVEHAACFQSCDAASSSAIDTFTACVRNDVCDADCSVNLKPPVVAPAPAPSDCSAACNTFAAACVPELLGQCTAVCGQLSDQEKALAVYCVSQRDGCNLPPQCEAEIDIGGGPAPDPAADCKDACDREAFFSCITAADQATCRNLCDTVDASTRDNYIACGSGSSGPCNSCYNLINSAGPSADVSGCKDACDQLKFFDCVDNSQQTTCRNTCETASKTQVDNFKACSQGLCDDDSCLQNLGL